MRRASTATGFVPISRRNKAMMAFFLILSVKKHVETLFLTISMNSYKIHELFMNYELAVCSFRSQ